MKSIIKLGPIDPPSRAKRRRPAPNASRHAAPPGAALGPRHSGSLARVCSWRASVGGLASFDSTAAAPSCRRAEPGGRVCRRGVRRPVRCTHGGRADVPPPLIPGAETIGVVREVLVGCACAAAQPGVSPSARSSSQALGAVAARPRAALLDVEAVASHRPRQQGAAVSRRRAVPPPRRCQPIKLTE